jgi:hypothetical protein
MLKQIRRTIATLHRLGKNDAGSVMPMFVLTLIPVLALVTIT